VTGGSAYGQEPIERWLASQHHELHEYLGQFLDVDAGLREASTHAKHTSLLRNFSSRLDTDAGLAAILPPPTSQLAAPLGQESGRLDIASVIAAADPALRLTVRRHPIVLAVITSDFLARTLEIADEPLSRDDRSIARTLAQDLAKALASALDTDRAVVDHAFDLPLGLALAFARSLSRDLVEGYSHTFAPVRDRALALARDLSRTRSLVRDLNHARALYLDLDLDVTNARDHACRLARELDYPGLDIFRTPSIFDGDSNLISRRAGDLARVRNLAHHLTLKMGGVLGLQHVDGLVEAVLDDVLDDFTHSSLANTDLTSVDLTGVRWSVSGTRWPPGTDIEVLRARSRETAPGTGIYVIERPGGMDKPVTSSLV
jgi:hypothetical protein